MEEQFAKLFASFPLLESQLSLEFCEAVDGSRVENLAEFEAYLPRWRFLTYCGRGGGSGILDAELACFASHLKLWKLCVQTGEDFVILEDDLYFEPCAFVDFLHFCKETECEFVKIKARDDGRYRHIEGKIYLCKRNFSLQSHAYYLKPSGAMKWLKCLRRFYYPVDFYMDMFYIHGVLNYTYIDEKIRPKPPQDEGSNIITQTKAKGSARWVRPFYKAYWHL